MIYAQVEQWKRDQAVEIAKVLNNADMLVRIRLEKAYELRQAQQQATMNTLGGQGLVAKFGAHYPLDSIEKIKNTLRDEKGLTGRQLDDAAYDFLKTPKKRTTEMRGGCFTKGTLVHTRGPLKTMILFDGTLNNPPVSKTMPLQINML